MKAMTDRELLEHFAPEHSPLVAAAQAKTGLDAVRILLENWGDETRYVPSLDGWRSSLFREVRDEQIRRAHQGNVMETAELFGVSYRTVYRALAEEKISDTNLRTCPASMR